MMDRRRYRSLWTASRVSLAIDHGLNTTHIDNKVCCCLVLLFGYSHLEHMRGDCGTRDSDEQCMKVWGNVFKAWESLPYITEA